MSIMSLSCFIEFPSMEGAYPRTRASSGGLVSEAGEWVEVVLIRMQYSLCFIDNAIMRIVLVKYAKV